MYLDLTRQREVLFKVRSGYGSENRTKVGKNREEVLGMF